MKRLLGTPLHDYLPAFGLLLLTVGYLLLSYGYPVRARVFPAMVAWVMLGLVTLDILSRTRTTLGRALLRALNPAAEAASETQRSGWREIGAMLWIAGFVAAVLLIGLLAAIPLYIFASMRLRGGCSYLACLATAGATTLFVWLMFSVLLRLNLYPGLFLSGA